jgi:hypothetical protein
MTMTLALIRAHLGDILRGATRGRYERELRQQTAELNDLFLLLCFMEAAGMPNPATLYLLEVSGWESCGRRSTACRAADGVCGFGSRHEGARPPQ